MAVRQYIGARYVAKVYENSQDPNTSEWEPGVTWEPLVIVTYQNGSYMSKKQIPGNIGNPPANPEYWTQTGFYNGQIASLQEQVSIINGRLNSIDGLIDTLEDAITAITRNIKELHGNLILNENYQMSTGLYNGSCYVGSNLIVSYKSPRTSNTGVLTCYNLSTFAIAWQHSIKGYHGNSLTYNPTTNKLYICGAIDNTDNSRINAIVEIDMANPDTVLREIVLPGITECYSLSYDPTTDKFYAIAYAGTTPGVANMMYVFSSDLTTLESSKLLLDYPAFEGLSTQGIQLVRNGVAYVLVYEPRGRAIYGYDIETGNIVTIASIPAVINKCRMVGEVQSIIYDYDHDNYYVGSMLWYPGVDGYYTHNIFEIDLFKGIEILYPMPQNTFLDMTDGINMKFIGMVLCGDSLRPSWTISPELITVPNDAFIYARDTNQALNIYIMRTSSGVTGLGTVLWNLMLDNFNGVIEGYDNTDKIHIKELRIKMPANVVFRRMAFEGFEIKDLATGYYGNMYVTDLARVFCQSCSFLSYTYSTTGNRYHIVAYLGSDVKSLSGSYQGTVDNNYIARNGATVSLI